MKIRKLHINRFGHFVEREINFPDTGLQIIYGPNEAGKTTLLEFLRGVLFDFPSRTPYDFGTQGELAGVIDLSLRDGRNIELRRRKGNKNKVAIKLNGKPADLDDAGWIRMIDHADRGLFESVFAFGLDKLSAGEESLKHESLQSALFSGGLGGTINPDQVMAELTKQSDELFKKSGQKPAINLQLGEIKRLTKLIKEKQLVPKDYQKAEELVATTSQRSAELHVKVDRLRIEHASIEKQVRGWPLWKLLRQLSEERSRLIVPDHLPADLRLRYTELERQLKAVRNEKQTLTADVENAEKKLGKLVLDPNSIAHRAEIRSCLELRESYVDAKKDLPERRRDREVIRTEIDKELAELRPGWTHDDLKKFSIDLATRSEIDRLSDQARDHFTQLTKLNAKRDGDSENLIRAHEELSELKSPRDLTKLVTVLAGEADFISNRKALKGLSSELAKLDRSIASQTRTLSPPLPENVDAPQKLPVPRLETVVEFAARVTGLRRQREQISSVIDQDLTEQKRLESQLNAEISTKRIPSLEERDTARQYRDEGWKLIRQKYILSEQHESELTAWLAGEPVDSLAEKYEQSIRTADNLADEIYINANEVAKREALRLQLNEINSRANENKKQLHTVDHQIDELQQTWVALWRPCGLTPLSPEAMQGWLNDHNRLCESHGQREELLLEQTQLQEQITSFELRLQEATGETSLETSELLTIARQLVDDTREQQRRRDELKKEVRRLERQLEGYRETADEMISLQAVAASEWKAVLNRLNLPVDWQHDLAVKVIDKLQATRIRLQRLPSEDERISAMERRIEEFERRVRAVCQEVAPDLLETAAETAIKKLEQQVEDAAENQRQHEELSSRLSLEKSKLVELVAQHQDLSAQLEQLFQHVGVTDEIQFLEVVERIEAAEKLDLQIEQLSRDIDLIRTTESREEFEQQLSSNELSILEAKAKDLEQELKLTEAARRDADGDAALALQALNQLDGSSEVALLNEELSQRRSLLVSELDRYMPLIYARHILKEAVRRFEKENQPEMIATVSRLFCEMTGGRYCEFDRTGGGKQSLIVRRADGIERTPDQLSTGTRELLYLAIRLGYVLHYCERNEPLPIIIDDVLANFDDQRARLTFETLAKISESIQVLFFTCHPHMVEIASQTVSGLSPITIAPVS